MEDYFILRLAALIVVLFTINASEAETLPDPVATRREYVDGQWQEWHYGQVPVGKSFPWSKE